MPPGARNQNLPIVANPRMMPNPRPYHHILYTALNPACTAAARWQICLTMIARLTIRMLSIRLRRANPKSNIVRSGWSTVPLNDMMNPMIAALRMTALISFLLNALYFLKLCQKLPQLMFMVMVGPFKRGAFK